MAIILKPIPAGGRRAEYITRGAADALVAAGEAVKCAGYPEIYEAVTDDERRQGYMTRDMQAVSMPLRKKDKPKARHDEASG